MLYYIKNGLPNLFSSFAGNGDRSDVDVSVMQPSLDYGLGQGWTLASSEMSFACDWRAGRWSSLATGLGSLDVTHLVYAGHVKGRNRS